MIQLETKEKKEESERMLLISPPHFGSINYE